MGIRFRKEMRVIKLIRLNVSKSGVSTTIGVPGASINIGRRGIFRNLGLPGTGFFMRDRISAAHPIGNVVRETLLMLLWLALALCLGVAGSVLLVWF
jgi:hypothetical protein